MTIIDKLKGVKKSPNGWEAQCPAHEDKHSSLSVAHRDGRWLLNCHAGCSVDAIVSAVGLKISDLFDSDARKPKTNGKSGSLFVAEYIYRTADGELSRKVCRTADKQFPQFRWTGSAWQNGVAGVPILPFRLPELVTANIETPVHVVEGEKDCEALARLGFVATTNPMGAGKWKACLNQWFANRHVFVIPDNDAPGRAHAEQVASALSSVAASVRVVHLPLSVKGADVSDWLVDDLTGARLVQECRSAPIWEPTASTSASDDNDKVIAELATLSEFAYQKCRKDKARVLGIQVAALDKIVKEQRAVVADEESELPHWKVEPWSGDVPGADFLDDLKSLFEKYIFLPPGAAEASALWTLHSWTMDAGDISPFLVLVSPTKRCGKTSMLILLMYLTPRSELASNISPSALFRYVEDVRPTLLIDEADSFVGENEEMRGILNSGHTKAAANVIRNVEINGEHKPRRFSTWAPKAIATIRTLADTLEDRSIVIQLQRKPKTAKVARLRKHDCDEFAILRRKAARWAEVNFGALATDPDPNIPEQLNDRAADNWRPLLQIANQCGGDWSQRARDVACLLSGEGHESTSIGVDLLIDIRLAFGEAEAMRSADLVAALNLDPERPWQEWKRGKPLTQKQLGGLLKPFHITSETVSIEGLKDARGYKRVRFADMWEAYLPTEKSGQNTSSPQILDSEVSKYRNATATGTSSDFRSVAEASGDGSKNDDLSYCRNDYDVSTLRKSESDAEENLTTNGAGTQPDDDLEIPPFLDRRPKGGAPAAEESDDYGYAGRDPEWDALCDELEQQRQCAQCRAYDGTETEFLIDGDRVWLHAECKRFYQKSAKQENASGVRQ
jgi:Protein of unknown function (DUF3631)